MINIKEFLRRNRPVFVLGALTLVSFLVIILLSINAPHQTPNMVTEKNTSDRSDSPFTVVSPESSLPPSFSTPQNPTSEPTDDDQNPFTNFNPEQPSSEDANIILITYDGKTFTPKNAAIGLGQTIRWQNQTPKNVYIKDKDRVLKEWDQPKELYGFGELEFTFDKAMIWSYEETLSHTGGTIEILAKNAEYNDGGFQK